MTPSPTSAGSGSTPVRVAILHNRYLPFDVELMRVLDTQLSARGFEVLTDQQDKIGVAWAKQLEQQLREADAVIPFISPGSARSEMLAYQLEIVQEAAQRRNGRLCILPIRLKSQGPMPEALASTLDPSQCKLWMGPQDNKQLVDEIAAGLREFAATAPSAGTPGARPAIRRSAPKTALGAGESPEASAPMPLEKLEPAGGAVSLASQFYIVRPPDDELRAAISRYDSIVLVKGARQMGKTSLLARGLQFAREQGAKVVFTDFQKLSLADLESPGRLYFTLAEWLAEQLDVPASPQIAWDDRRAPNVNFDRYLRREILSKLDAPLVWGLDEVDRLFTCSFGSEVFGLFRSWHNERALDPSGPWGGLTLAIAYATEAHLFITDLNQSPFNVGTRLALEDFTAEQVAELNRRHGSPLRNDTELNRLVQLIAGHPFLVRCALHEMATKRLSLDQFETQADHDEGIFGDHLRRILVLLAKDPALLEVVRGVLRGQPCPNQESFFRLRSAGVMSGHGPNDTWPRCQLYARYLARHLL